MTGNLISTVADVLRMVYGGYGAILRQDGGGFYILLTNKDAANGAFNSLRPLRIDLATGNIEFGQTANASVLQEKGQRVYSPNNKPSAADIGALPAAGTAAAATKLATARKINGVTFDGTADINLTPQNLGLVGIVETGSGTGYYWRKYADGKIEIFARFSSTYGAVSDVVFPKVFTEIPLIFVKENGTTGDNGWLIRVKNLSKTGFTVGWNVFSATGSGSAMEICYHAIGS